MQNILLDTNALLMPFQFRLNIDAELFNLIGPHKVYVPATVIKELERLKNLRKNKLFDSALKLAKKYEIVDMAGPVDKVILKLAQKLDAYVVTNDAELQKQLRAANVKVIFLRSRKRLAIL